MLYDGYWIPVKDGDDRARALFDRHYSRIRYADGRKPRRFAGPGEKMVLLTDACDALFIWRKFQDASGQTGINCAVFRNEGPILSSVLIAEAEQWAWAKWPNMRLYTYIGFAALPWRPRAWLLMCPLWHPALYGHWLVWVLRRLGTCFIRAGWQPCGTTKVNGLLILERLPTIAEPNEGSNP